MNVIVKPGVVSGYVKAPASKSAMQRACALALINKGDTYLKNIGTSNDDIAAIDVISMLGAKVIKKDNHTLLIKGSTANQKQNILNCGESGLGLRMFTPLAALNSFPITINGSGSLLNRPIDFFDEVLPQLGVRAASNHGKLPLFIQGPLIPKNITVDGSLSSQFLTGLLISFAVSCTSPVTITVKNLKSKPYIDLTLHMLKHFGWTVLHENYTKFYFTPFHPKDDYFIEYTVEGDWSGGSFLLVAGAIAGNVNISGLSMNSTQADVKIMEALKDCGADLSILDDVIQIKSNSQLKAFEFDATDCPDLFPPLVALASFCNGQTVLKGVNRLRHKESDRASTLKSEFSKMGVTIELNNDLMLITGLSKIHECQVSSHHDHRIAMACTVAALRADGPVQVFNAEAVNKSYPDFYDHMRSLKCSIEGI